MGQTVEFGRYRLTGLLGKGGFATVYRAVMSGPMGFEKDVALKRINDEVTQDERLIRSLVNEARLGGRLKHPNVVETYEFNQIGDIWFMALEFVDGWPLDAILKRCRSAAEPVPVSVVYEIMLQACSGLHYAHSLASRDGTPANLIHRDLKPANLMVSRSGIVKVMDFGIAKAATNLYQTTEAEGVKGTPVYMSPEQLRAETLDRRSDLFSMGSVFHELVTLRIPFYADNILAITYLIAEADITTCLARVRSRHPPMEEILARCMAKDPSERYASAEALSAALRAAARTAPAGPTLAQWLEAIEHQLPAPRAPGDFGSDGPPPSVVGAELTSSQSPTAVAAAFDETVDLPNGLADAAAPPPAPPPAHPQSDEPTAASPGPTRAFPPVVEERGPGRAIGVAVLILLVCGAAALALWGGGQDEGESVLASPAPMEGGDGGRPPEGPAITGGEVVAQVDATGGLQEAGEADESSASGEAVEGDAPVAEPPAKESPAPTPRPAPTPVAAKPAPVAAKPAPAVEATPAPAEPAVQAQVIINSVPWSEIVIDGKPVGRTMLRTELPVGDHEVRLVCGACAEGGEETKTLSVRAGQTNRLIHTFSP